jgi:putative Mg2+ transporter-C (MgtC) family protein
MDVAVADDRLAVTRGPALGAAVEIERARVHRIPLDGVEHIGVPLEIAAETRRPGKERMRRDHQPALARFQVAKLRERPDRVGATAKIQQQDVPSFDRPFDARNQDDAALGGVRLEATEIELLFVKRDRDSVVAEMRRAVDQVQRRMGNRVNRVVAGMGVQLNLQHRRECLLQDARRSGGAPNQSVSGGCSRCHGNGFPQVESRALESASPCPSVGSEECDVAQAMRAIDIILRLLLAASLGAALGLEREMRQKPAGLRTNMLIAVGSALFSLISIQLAPYGGSADRVAANIVTGVGFLGGGAILRSGRNVMGMTTAATIWVNAAIGMAAGIGESTLAISGTGITLMVLGVLPPIERYFEGRTAVPHNQPEH